MTKGDQTECEQLTWYTHPQFQIWDIAVTQLLKVKLRMVNC